MPVCDVRATLKGTITVLRSVLLTYTPIVIAGFFTGGALAVRGGVKAARNSAIGCAILLAVIEGVGIGIQRMMAEQTRLDVSCAILPCPNDPKISTARKSNCEQYMLIVGLFPLATSPTTGASSSRTFKVTYGGLGLVKMMSTFRTMSLYPTLPLVHRVHVCHNY